MRYLVLICDFYENEIIDIAYCKTKEEVNSYMEEHSLDLYRVDSVELNGRKYQLMFTL